MSGESPSINTPGIASGGTTLSSNRKRSGAHFVGVVKLKTTIKGVPVKQEPTYSEVTLAVDELDTIMSNRQNSANSSQRHQYLILPVKEPSANDRSRLERLRTRTAIYKRETKKAGHLLYDKLKHLLPIAVLLIYWAAGGFLFYALEGDNPLYGKIVGGHKLELGPNSSHIRNKKIQLAVSAILRVVDEGNSSVGHFEPILRNLLKGDEQHSDYQKWTMWDSLFYAGTIFTTIGYGVTSPQTREGRICTVIYAIIGIPLMLMVLANVGRLFCVWIWKAYNTIVSFFIHFFGRCCPASAVDEIGQFPVSIAVGITIAWILFCSWVFTLFERSWSFPKSIYFFMISFTTIGLGDVYPKEPNGEVMVLMFAFVVVGMAMVSMVWNLMQIKMETLVRRIAQGIDQLKPADQPIAVTTTDRSMDAQIGKLAGDENHWLVALMGESQKNDLVRAWQQRARLVNKGVQCKIINIDAETMAAPETDIKSAQVNLDCIMTRGSWVRRDSSRSHHTSSPSSTPYREIKRASSTDTTDEFKRKLKDLNNILTDCREIVRSESSGSCSTPCHSSSTSAEPLVKLL